MMKAILIDDEKLIRQGLVSYIDWASLGIEVCAVCADCASGLQAVIEHRPQILLADICLPDASGLDLFRQIRSYGFECQVIFISSYSEFQYAQQAVKLGAFDYLLKPIESDVLYECVRRCAQKISMEHSQTHTSCDRSLLEKVLKDALTSLPQAGNTFLRLAGQRGLPQEAAIFLVISTNYKAAAVEKISCPSSLFLDSYQTRLSGHISVSCLFATPGMETAAQQFLLKVTDHSSLVFTKYGQKDGLSLYQCFQEALGTLILKDAPFRQQETLFLEKQQELSPLVIQHPTPEHIHLALYQFFSYCVQRHYCRGHLDFQFECFRFLENIYKQLCQYYGLPLPPGIDMHNFIEQLREPENIYDLFLTLKSIVSNIFEEIRQSCGHSPYTRRALSIIRSRYNESLSLKSVAKELHVSPSYLSAVFKEDTGRPFSDCLLAYRMNLALALVKEGNCRVYEIGERVGYPDIAQFSKCFKKYFGYSPKQMKSNAGTEPSLPPFYR